MNEYNTFFPDTFTLETQKVLLRIMQPEDVAALSPLTKSPDIWKYFTKDLYTDEELQRWVNDALREKAEEKRVPFTVIDKANNYAVCGSTSYGSISFFDKRIEIGWSWLGVHSMGTGINRHAKFALLSYAFEVMKMERVEIKTDLLNERARAALLKVGMIPEGVLRSHMQMHSNRRRDSIYFSMLRPEWEERKYQFFMDLL
jgi:RimJ/RimL family protein N-acetyltransferase